MVHDQCGAGNIGSLVGDRNCAVRNTPPATMGINNKQEDRVRPQTTGDGNTTWCTLPESDYVVAGGHLQFEGHCVGGAMQDRPASVCRSSCTGGVELPVVYGERRRTTADDSCDLSRDGAGLTVSESIRQSTPTGYHGEKDGAAVNHTETVSTQTDFAPSASLSRQHHEITERETVSAVTQHRLSNAPVSALQDHSIVNSIRHSSRQSVRELSPPCFDSTFDHETKDTELLSVILNQSPLATTACGLEGLSISLIDDTSDEQCQDDEQLIKDVFYIT